MAQVLQLLAQMNAAVKGGRDNRTAAGNEKPVRPFNLHRPQLHAVDQRLARPNVAEDNKIILRRTESRRA